MHQSNPGKYVLQRISCRLRGLPSVDTAYIVEIRSLFALGDIDQEVLVGIGGLRACLPAGPPPYALSEGTPRCRYPYLRRLGTTNTHARVAAWTQTGRRPASASRGYARSPLPFMNLKSAQNLRPRILRYRPQRLQQRHWQKHRCLPNRCT